jgi:hypothetical protein
MNFAFPGVFPSSRLSIEASVLQLRSKYFFEFVKLRTDHHRAIRVGVLVVLIILLVIGFSRIKRAGRGDLCYNIFGECAAFVQLVLIILSFFLLVLVMIEDHAAVLRAFIGALPVERSRIMNLEKYFQ